MISLKKYWQRYLPKNWQGLIGDEFKLTGNDCGRDDQAMAVHIQCNCWRLVHLWKWFGLEGGLEWSSAKGLVASCCNLFPASILSSELSIEVFSSFGTTRII